jgi:D-aminoacyl-tRNA deacylase
VRFLVQRVSRAAVRVGGKLEGSIGPGLLVLVGVAAGDERSDADYLADKLVHLRIFADEHGRMNRSALETGAGVLIVSQFTLYADCSRGRRPGFDLAAPPEQARELYDYVADRLREKVPSVQTGVFQAHMEVELVNDGPATFWLESPRRNR